MLSLRDYQEEIVAKVRHLLLAGKKSILIQLPTGGGKTVLCARMLGTAARRSKKSWFIVHRRELVKQSAKTFNFVEIPHGIISADFPMALHYMVQICSIQTLARRITKFKAPDLIVWDECHHLAAGSWAAVMSMFPDTIHIGLSATPHRLDGRGLRKYFGEMVQGPTVKWLIEHGFLSRFKMYAPSVVNTEGVHDVGGDYNRKELADAMNKSTVTGDAVAHYLKLARGKRALAFEVSVERSKHLAEKFTAAGVPAEHVDAETDPRERDAILSRFETGKTLILTNVDLFGEGFDVPAIEAVILCRPTKSLTVYLQQIGRALRPAEGKDFAIILDHAGNCMRHGMPDDDREWSLDGRKKRKAGEIEIKIKHCPKCYHVMLSSANTCPGCGHVFQIVNTREVVNVEGDLVEIKRIQQIQRKREQGSAETFEQLVELGKQRGYKSPVAWAKFVWQSRQSKKAATTTETSPTAGD